METYENIIENYEAMDKENPMLNKRHAEKINKLCRDEGALNAGIMMM